MCLHNPNRQTGLFYISVPREKYIGTRILKRKCRRQAYTVGDIPTPLVFQRVGLDWTGLGHSQSKAKQRIPERYVYIHLFFRSWIIGVGSIQPNTVLVGNKLQSLIPDALLLHPLTILQFYNSIILTSPSPSSKEKHYTTISNTHIDIPSPGHYRFKSLLLQDSEPEMMKM